MKATWSLLAALVLTTTTYNVQGAHPILYVADRAAIAAPAIPVAGACHGLPNGWRPLVAGGVVPAGDYINAMTEQEIIDDLVAGCGRHINQNIFRALEAGNVNRLKLILRVLAWNSWVGHGSLMGDVPDTRFHNFDNFGIQAFREASVGVVLPVGFGHLAVPPHNARIQTYVGKLTDPQLAQIPHNVFATAGASDEFKQDFGALINRCARALQNVLMNKNRLVNSGFSIYLNRAGFNTWVAANNARCDLGQNLTLVQSREFQREVWEAAAQTNDANCQAITFNHGNFVANNATKDDVRRTGPLLVRGNIVIQDALQAKLSPYQLGNFNYSIAVGNRCQHLKLSLLTDSDQLPAITANCLYNILRLAPGNESIQLPPQFFDPVTPGVAGGPNTGGIIDTHIADQVNIAAPAAAAHRVNLEWAKVSWTTAHMRKLMMRLQIRQVHAIQLRDNIVRPKFIDIHAASSPSVNFFDDLKKEASHIYNVAWWTGWPIAFFRNKHVMDKAFTAFEAKLWSITRFIGADNGPLSTNLEFIRDKDRLLAILNKNDYADCANMPVAELANVKGATLKAMKPQCLGKLQNWDTLIRIPAEAALAANVVNDIIRNLPDAAFADHIGAVLHEHVWAAMTEAQVAHLQESRKEDRCRGMSMQHFPEKRARSLHPDCFFNLTTDPANPAKMSAILKGGPANLLFSYKTATDLRNKLTDAKWWGVLRPEQLANVIKDPEMCAAIKAVPHATDANRYARINLPLKTSADCIGRIESAELSKICRTETINSFDLDALKDVHESAADWSEAVAYMAKNRKELLKHFGAKAQGDNICSQFSIGNEKIRQALPHLHANCLAAFKDLTVSSMDAFSKLPEALRAHVKFEDLESSIGDMKEADVAKLLKSPSVCSSIDRETFDKAKNGLKNVTGECLSAATFEWSKEDLAKVPAESGKSLEPAFVSKNLGKLSTGQVSNLGENAKAIQAVNELSIEQVGAVKPVAFEHFSDKAFQTLDKAHWNAVSPDNVAVLTKKQAMAMPQYVFLSMTVAQATALGTKVKKPEDDPRLLFDQALHAKLSPELQNIIQVQGSSGSRLEMGVLAMGMTFAVAILAF